MSRRKPEKPYRIYGAYDSETSNVCYSDDGVKRYRAFPILHQLGILGSTLIEDVTPENVEQVTQLTMYRHTFELCAALDEICGTELGFVPVVVCHNLSFDMYPLAEWLSGHDTKVLAKSKRKPISFTVLDDEGKPCLVIWDTLIFSQQPLDSMGRDCGYLKASGKWDYSLVRTPETPLTPDEIEYASRDVYTLLCWLSWWLKVNPDISPDMLGINVVTKTGVVRKRRVQRFYNLKAPGSKWVAGQGWMYQNRDQVPKTDDELFTLHACTRGGFTFCSMSSAFVPYLLDGTGAHVVAYDATSQHPAQMVSHMYPERFRAATPEELRLTAVLIAKTSLERVLEFWHNPFGVAVDACYEIVNIRPKAGSVFGKYGVLPLASARFRSVNWEYDEDNAQRQLFREHSDDMGYKDYALNPVFALGKLVSADRCRVWVTELALWELTRCYEWDSIEPVSGYITMSFCKPTDMSMLSVMQFYQAKNVFKGFRAEYKANGKCADASALSAYGISDSFIAGLEAGTLPETETDYTYLRMKADLNALFGIEACNEYRQDTFIGDDGIEYQGEFGIGCKPKNPKAWYQFGQRIVGWSRIAQVCVMELADSHIEGIVNGDTDSVKFIVQDDKRPELENALQRYSDSLTKAKRRICSRVERAFPELFDNLEGIGAYVFEFEATRFFAAWNKAYAEMDGAGNIHFTLAGIPTENAYGADGEIVLERLRAFAEHAMREWHWTFTDVCNRIFSFNVTLHSSVTGLNARTFPEWGEAFADTITDYQGRAVRVFEPAALALYPMNKDINSYSQGDNSSNWALAVRNNPAITLDNAIIFKDTKGNFRYELL